LAHGDIAKETRLLFVGVALLNSLLNFYGSPDLESFHFQLLFQFSNAFRRTFQSGISARLHLFPSPLRGTCSALSACHSHTEALRRIVSEGSRECHPFVAAFSFSVYSRFAVLERCRPAQFLRHPFPLVPLPESGHVEWICGTILAGS
ncbi:hypothetical protein PFISCL1PPCAC_28342, partial [Pristionchus fissidentatus]